MATAQKENKHSFASILLVVVMLGSLASLVFIPVETFQAVREVEQAQIRKWLGNETDQWIMIKIVDLLQWLNTEGGHYIDKSEVSGNSKIDSWVLQRVYAALVWGHFVLYRAGLLVMWLCFGIPLLAAALLDGHYQREIRKATFSSQSPALHKSGLDAAKLTIALVIAWLFIPYHITMLVAPFGIAVTGIAGWIWYANMQKRM